MCAQHDMALQQCCVAVGYQSQRGIDAQSVHCYEQPHWLSWCSETVRKQATDVQRQGACWLREPAEKNSQASTAWLLLEEKLGQSKTQWPEHSRAVMRHQNQPIIVTAKSWNDAPRVNNNIIVSEGWQNTAVQRLLNSKASLLKEQWGRSFFIMMALGEILNFVLDCYWKWILGGTKQVCRSSYCSSPHQASLSPKP